MEEATEDAVLSTLRLLTTGSGFFIRRPGMRIFNGEPVDFLPGSGWELEATPFMT